MGFLVGSVSYPVRERETFTCPIGAVRLARDISYSAGISPAPAYKTR